MTIPAPVCRSATVSKAPAEAFRIFTEEIGAWWPLPTHGLFGDQSGGVAFRDGQVIETRLDGDELVWGEVLVWEPPSRLVLSWHPGQGADDASQVIVDFEPYGEGTRVVVEHHGWESFGADAMARRRGYVGPGAWGHVLDHYADGVEPRIDPADLTGLADAYGRFFAVAEAGSFGPAPSGGEWDADQTIAHVALNDAAMLAVCHAVVHQRQPTFENVVCQDPDVLSGWIEACGDRAGLIARGRQQAHLVLAALTRLSADQRATEVQCRLLHDGETMLDGVRPWGAVAIEVQAGMHLPAHTTQLEDLRTSP